MNTFTRRTVLQSIAVACVVAAVPAFAKDSDDWDELGDAEFDDDTDEKVIAVSALKGKFRSIKFKANNADAQIEEITIHPVSGDKIEKNIRDTVKKGEETRPIVLDVERDVVIRRVTIKAKCAEKGKKTKIEAYGKN